MTLSNGSYFSFGSSLSYHSRNVVLDDFFSPVDQVIPSDDSFKSFNFDLGVMYKLNKLTAAIASQNVLGERNSGLIIGTGDRYYNSYLSYEIDLLEGVKLIPFIFYERRALNQDWRLDTAISLEFWSWLALGYNLQSYRSDRFSVFTASLIMEDWVRVNMVLYDQTVQGSDSHSRFGNNLEIGLSLMLPD